MDYNNLDNQNEETEFKNDVSYFLEKITFWVRIIGIYYLIKMLVTALCIIEVIRSWQYILRAITSII